jgi:hypothetical protein
MRDSDDFVARVTDNRIRPAAHGGVLSFAREKALKTGANTPQEFPGIAVNAFGAFARWNFWSLVRADAGRALVQHVRPALPSSIDHMAGRVGKMVVDRKDCRC